MTNEEAKKKLEARLKCLIAETSGTNYDCNMRLCDGCSLNYEQGNMGEQKQALDMAIKALEQQSCEDCISRQAVIDFIIDNYGVGFNSLTNGIRDYLPSVTPKRPKGKWIFCYGNKGKDNVEKCSCCKSYWKEAVIYRYDTQEYLRLRLKYCPKCGAEMEGEENANNN